MRTAGLIATGLLAVLALFQLAVAAGAPLGRWSWGGQQEGVLPVRYRVASGLAGLLLYPAMAMTILGTAGLTDNALVANRTAMWVLAGFFALGTVANFASRSRYERVWGPVSLALAICCGVIALAL